MQSIEALKSYSHVWDDGLVCKEGIQVLVLPCHSESFSKVSSACEARKVHLDAAVRSVSVLFRAYF